jgi:hypothetical protein
VADPFDWLALLPPISRAVHLAGPALQAQRLVELWKVDGDVALGEAFHLLTAPVVEQAVWRSLTSDDYEPRSDPRHWAFPGWGILLPLLQAEAWGEALAGRLQITAIEQGKRRRRVVKPVELPRLEPDGMLGRLQSDGVDRFVDVRVRPKPEPKPEFKLPTAREWKDAIEKLPPDLTEEKRHEALEGLLGAPLRREDVRGAVKDYQPNLIKRVGRPRKAKSRQ